MQSQGLTAIGDDLAITSDGVPDLFPAPRPSPNHTPGPTIHKGVDGVNSGNLNLKAKGLTNLTKSQLKSITSFEKQINTHIQKLNAYKANPYKFDNKGFLKNAPNNAVRQKIIQSRINHLNHEINTFQNNIQKILNRQ